jgi:hypothetical protein
MSAKERFEYFFKEKFAKTDMWRAMQNERENSPWHREANVAVHTEMLLRWYNENLCSNRSEWQQMITRVACLMHDIGKPPSRIVKESEERGVYNAYHGHELVSARMWTNYAVNNVDVRDILAFNKEDIAFVALMLEHHVPFALANTRKRHALKMAFYGRKGDEGHRAWLDLLLSDQHGRISDGQAEKLKAVDDWMRGWEQVKWQSE